MITCQSAVSCPVLGSSCRSFSSGNCEDLADRVNKKINGEGFCVIHNPEGYKTDYSKRIKRGKESIEDIDECMFASSGDYDLTEVDSPKMEGDRLVFFIHENGKYPTPRKVTINPESLEGRVECLPYANPNEVWSVT